MGRRLMQRPDNLDYVVEHVVRIVAQPFKNSIICTRHAWPLSGLFFAQVEVFLERL